MTTKYNDITIQPRINLENYNMENNMETTKNEAVSETKFPSITADPQVEVAWPRGEKAVEAFPLARRLDSLEGKTIGIIWDWVYRGDEIYPIVQAELTKQYPDIKFIDYEVFGNPHSAHEAEVFKNLPKLSAEHGCDAFIVGVGC